jgi:hypothetical protein
VHHYYILYLSIMLSINEFMKYKELNIDMLPELRNIANNMNSKLTPQQLYNKNKCVNNGKKYRYNKHHDKNVHNNIGKPNTINNHDNINNHNTFVNDQHNNEPFTLINRELNKLSPNNINSIVQVIIQLNLKEQSIVDNIIDEICKKSIIEVKFTFVYAKLCKTLVDKLSSNQLFRCTLLNKSQVLFNNVISFCENANYGEYNTSFYKSKNIMLGAITFIGGLYNECILSLKLVILCCNIMLEKIENGLLNLLDPFVQLLITIVKKFVTEQHMKDTIDNIFHQLNNIKNNPAITKKDKFTIMDLLDAKTNNKWI